MFDDNVAITSFRCDRNDERYVPVASWGFRWLEFMEECRDAPFAADNDAN